MPRPCPPSTPLPLFTPLVDPGRGGGVVCRGRSRGRRGSKERQKSDSSCVGAESRPGRRRAAKPKIPWVVRRLSPPFRRVRPADGRYCLLHTLRALPLPLALQPPSSARCPPPLVSKDYAYLPPLPGESSPLFGVLHEPTAWSRKRIFRSTGLLICSDHRRLRSSAWSRLRKWEGLLPLLNQHT